MLDKCSLEQPASMLSRPGAMYNGQGNLSKPMFQAGGYPKTGSNVRHNEDHVMFSNNNDCLQQQIFHDSADDEFSDFQSAPPAPTGNQTNKFPVESVQAQFTLNNYTQPATVFNPSVGMSTNTSERLIHAGGGGRGKIKESAVGCRLANYDLGFPTASPRHRHQQAQVVPIRPQLPSINSAAVSSNSNPSGDGLLIGEEDRYSALRGLMDDVTVETSIFDSLGTENSVGKSVCNVQHKISLVSDDVIQVVKTETTDSADFGEFQSFGVEHESGAYHPQAQVQTPLHFDFHGPSIVTSRSNNVADLGNIIPPAVHPHPVQVSTPPSRQDDLLNLDFAFCSQPRDLPSTASSCCVTSSNPIPIVSTTPNNSTCNNNSSFSDGEFGDFVGFSETVAAPSKHVIIPVVPPSPKLVLKTDIPKKGSGKSKKSSHSSGKPLTNRIAKASCILTESPTLPKPDDSRLSPVDPIATLPYEPSGVLQSTFSTEIDDLFDLRSGPTVVDNLAFDVEDRPEDVPIIPTELDLDFGAPPKAGFLCSSSSDDFGDFSTASQIQPSDPTMKSNNLDLLAFTKRKTHSPVETQSLASLDLGIYVESGEGKQSGDNEASPETTSNLEFETYVKDNGSEANAEDSFHSSVSGSQDFPLADTEASRQTPQIDDKYSCFKEEIENERERCTTEWTRCLKSCLKLITQAHSVLNSASSSEVVREIVSNEKGQSYVLNLIQVYQIARRIHQSWLKMGGDLKMKQVLDDVVTSWESLTTFFLGTPVMGTVAKIEDEREAECLDILKVCGVCLVGSNGESSESLLDYGGKCYHAACANLWINQVDSILPSLYCISAL